MPQICACSESHRRFCVFRGHWWCRLAINLEHTGQDVRALEASESALADGWVRGGSQLDLQRRILRLGKPPRRWRKPVWAPEAVWEPQSVHIDAAPIVSGVGTGVGMRNRYPHHQALISVDSELVVLFSFSRACFTSRGCAAQVHVA